MIMAEFDKVEQSFRAKGLPSLFSQPLHIELLLGPSNDEVNELLHSAGSGRKKTEIFRNVNASSLIIIAEGEYDATNNYCLFDAIAMGILYRKNLEIEDVRQRKTAQKQFERLATQQGFYEQRRKQMRMELLDHIIASGFNIPYDLAAYSTNEHLPLIQQYFYQLPQPQQCRLIVFGEHGMFKPLFKGSKRARYDIPLFISEGHFFPIRNLNTFMGLSSNLTIVAKNLRFSSTILHRL
jgi:hypothetical protein